MVVDRVNIMRHIHYNQHNDTVGTRGKYHLSHIHYNQHNDTVGTRGKSHLSHIHYNQHNDTVGTRGKYHLSHIHYNQHNDTVGTRGKSHLSHIHAVILSLKLKVQYHLCRKMAIAGEIYVVLQPCLEKWLYVYVTDLSIHRN